MTGLRGVILLYAFIDIADGLQGYLAIGKLPWLVWNAGFGAIVIGGVALSKKSRSGFAICALFAALDTVFFGRKLVVAPAVWPAGITTFAALCALVCAVAGMNLMRRPPRDLVGSS